MLPALVIVQKIYEFINIVKKEEGRSIHVNFR